MRRFMLFLAALAFAQVAPAQTAADRQQLAAELQAEVRGFRANLPMRDGVLTITAVELRGIEIVYTGNVHADFDDRAIDVFRREVARGLCTGNTGEVIRRGGAFTYDLRDEAGERFVTTVASCR
jgi:hypothetical protein